MTTLLQTHTQLTLAEVLAMPETKPAAEFSNSYIGEKPRPCHVINKAKWQILLACCLIG